MHYGLSGVLRRERDQGMVGVPFGIAFAYMLIRIPFQRPLERRQRRHVRVGTYDLKSEVISVVRSDLHAFRVGAKFANQPESETRRALRIGGPRRTSHVILKASVVNIRKCHL